MRAKPEISKICASIIAITDKVCKKHLNEDYAELARKLTTALSEKCPSPLLNGVPKSWACAIVYALGKVHFLFDSSQHPYFSSKELCALFGVSQQTGCSKAGVIWQMMEMMQLDPRWCVSKNLTHNPISMIAPLPT